MKTILFGRGRIFALLLALVLLFSVQVPAFSANDITVYVDNIRLEFDVQPQMISGRTMVPLRAIFEALGATVEWDGATQTVTAYNDQYFVIARIGDTSMTVNNTLKTMDIAPLILNGRTLVPARFVAEAFDCTVQWIGETRSVYIFTSDVEDDLFENITATPTPSQPVVQGGKHTVTLNEYSFDPTRTLEIECTNVIRGETANEIIHSENRFNDTPTESQEWIIMEFDVSYLSSTDGKYDDIKGSDVIYKDTFYTTGHKSITAYDLATLGDRYGDYGVFDVKMYPGDTKKIVIGLLIDKNLGEVVLKVPDKNGNKVNWINCSSNATVTNNVHSASGGIGNTVSDNSTQTQTTSKKYYSGSSIPTYTSVTGVPLKKTDYLSDGSPLYIYEYTDSDDVGDYWRELYANGWSQYEGDDTSTDHVFESTMRKGYNFVIVNVYLNFNEVWISGVY